MSVRRKLILQSCLLPLLFFMIGLVWQLVRLGVITGIGLILDTTLLRAWHHADPGAAWVRYRDQPAVFGYKVHTLLCRDAMLPILCLVTPANICDAALAIPMPLASVLLFGFQVGVVYADAAYFEYAILSFIVQVLGASLIPKPVVALCGWATPGDRASLRLGEALFRLEVLPVLDLLAGQSVRLVNLLRHSGRGAYCPALWAT